MISQVEAPEKVTARPATKGLNETDARLYQSIPDHVDYVPHPDYLRRATEKELFGPEAPTISLPRWRLSPELQDRRQAVDLPPAKPISRQDEALLFRRYNCARYHLANLMEKQSRRFARGRVPEILAWYRRTLENRAVLTQANMALVVAMASRTTTNAVELGELVSEGNMALLRAVDKFDFSRGFRFSTYATCAILNAFSRLAAKVATYRQRFPTNSDPETQRGRGLGTLHADQRALTLEDLQQVLTLNRARLTDVEQRVLRARFALVGHDRGHTLQEVSALVRLSIERVRQIQNQALTKLRLALELAFSPATRSPGKTRGAFENLTTTFPGRPGLGVPAAAGCGR